MSNIMTGYKLKANRRGMELAGSLMTILVVMTVVLTGCSPQGLAGGSGAGNPGNAVASVALRAVTRQTGSSKRLLSDTLKLSDSTGTIIKVHELLLSVRYISLYRSDRLDCTGFDTSVCRDARFTVNGPFVFDLLSEKSIPPVPDIHIPAGTYRELHLGLYDRLAGDTLADSVPDLVGYTLFLQGSFAYGDRVDRQLSVLLRINDEPEFMNLRDGAIVLDTTQRSRIIVELDVADWLSRMDLAGCLNSGEARFDSAGNLRVLSHTPCGEIQNIIDRSIYQNGSVVIESLLSTPIP